MSNSLDRRIYSFFKKGVYDDPLKLNRVSGVTVLGADIAAGNAIDLSGAFVGHGIYIHAATFATAKRALRIGDYGTEIALAGGEGIIRTYAKISSGTTVAALQFHWGFTTTTAPLIGSQMQMESHAATPGPNGVMVLDLLAGVEDLKYIASGGDGLVALRCKVFSGNGTNINGNVFALWLDHQVNVGGPNAIEASIRGTTGGSVPDAFIQLETTSNGWSQFLKLDASMATKQPFVATGCSVTVATVPYLKVDVNGTQYGIPLIAI